MENMNWTMSPALKKKGRLTNRMLRDAHMLQAEIKKTKMKNIHPTQHRTKDGDRQTKQGENMIQIIVLNIAKCNYQQNSNNTRLIWPEPERACARLPTMQRSLRNIPIYLVFLSFVVGASATISLHFC